MSVDTGSGERLAAERPARWWHDRALVALLALFLVLAPLVTHRIYASDEIQYYSYTHSLFFDGDLDFSDEYLHFYDSDRTKFADIYRDLYLKHEPLTNLPLNVAPIGTGLMWMPSYALAHVFALTAHALGSKVEADGYSGPYIFAVCMTSYLFGCIALLLCYNMSKRLFGRGLSALAVVTMWLATPLLFYTVVAPPWSHATSFLAVTLFLWYWERTRFTDSQLRTTYYELKSADNEITPVRNWPPKGRRPSQWVILGALAGLMMLVREQDALFLVVPFVEAVAANFGGIRRGAQGVKSLGHWVFGLVLAGATAAIVFIPQLIAYRVITGRFAPSKVVSSKFNWTSPNALNVLFSPEHGLIPWTPVIVLALVGLGLLWKRDRVLTSALVISFLLQVYIAGSFLTWQSAGSFGQRRFINSTLIFVLGFAMLAQWVIARGVPTWLVGVVAAIFVAWNGGLLMQYALWCSPQRQGLDWAVVIKGQAEIPFRAAGLLWDYLTNRDRFYRATRQC